MRSRSVFSLIGSAFIYLLTAIAANAQVPPPPPTVLDVGPGGCIASDEICGDGIDQDCNGSDVSCPGGDSDRDGYLSGADCDDSNRNIFPGIAVPCSAGCGQGSRTCQANGAFTSCTCANLCEATGSGRCFYISSQTGSDSNPGTYAAPWKTYRNINYYEGGVGAPSTRVTLQAGDVVYFLSGVYRDTLQYNGRGRGLVIRLINGTSSAPVVFKAYPGAHPVFWPGSPADGIYIIQSSHIRVEGIEVTGAYGAGVNLAEASNVELVNLWVHDTDGNDDNNIAGVYFLGTQNSSLHHSLIHDNYDRLSPKSENSRNIVLFGGGNVRIHHNEIFQTPPTSAAKTGSCITHKHSQNVSGAFFEVDHNILRNCFQHAIGSGSYGTRIHHNLIIDSDPIELRDFGGPTYHQDVVIEYNTFVRGAGLKYNPSTTWAPLGPVTFRRNVVWDNGSYGQERGIVTIGTYQSDSLYNLVLPTLSFSQNCYYNSGSSPAFAFFAANGGAYGSQGGVYSFSQWRNFNFDTNSATSDPGLDSNFIAQAGACAANGWNAP